MTDKVKAPEYGELAEALRVMTYAYDAITTRDALRYIGLGHKSTFPGMPGDIKSTDDARHVLIQLEESLGEDKRAEMLWSSMEDTPGRVIR